MSPPRPGANPKPRAGQTKSISLARQSVVLSLGSRNMNTKRRPIAASESDGVTSPPQAGAPRDICRLLLFVGARGERALANVDSGSGQSFTWRELRQKTLG